MWHLIDKWTGGNYDLISFWFFLIGVGGVLIWVLIWGIYLVLMP